VELIDDLHAGRPASMANRRRRWKLLFGVLCGAGLVWGGWAWWIDRRYKSAMEEIGSEVMAGRHAIACRNLEQLLSWKADPNGGIAYLLGSCELARGRPDAAGEAWARVVPGSAFSERAIRARMQLCYQSGEFAAAERLIDRAGLDRRNDRTAVRVLLVPLLSELGRIDEAQRLLEDRWSHLNSLGEGALEPAIKLLLEHVGLTFTAAPVERLRASLDRAGGLASDDDRVWLGRANLAIRTGAYDQAEQWLDACQERRPHDVPVWRARLIWGVSSHRTSVVQTALHHLPATEGTPVLLGRLKVWLAASRRDVGAERRELERLIVTDPTDETAWDRLANLAAADGEPAKTTELRSRKNEVDRLQARYAKLYGRNQPIRDAAEMADLAEQLGRTFEARVFLTLAIAEHPDRPELRHDLTRLASSPTAVAHDGRTLAEVVGLEPDDEKKMAPGAEDSS
jgi:tetratricopeptide (TPR) repeat protein